MASMTNTILIIKMPSGEEVEVNRMFLEEARDASSEKRKRYYLEENFEKLLPLLKDGAPDKVEVGLEWKGFSVIAEYEEVTEWKLGAGNGYTQGSRHYDTPPTKRRYLVKKI